MKEISFEEAMTELEKTVNELEFEKLNLDDYKPNIDIKYVSEKLNNLEKKLKNYIDLMLNFVEINEKHSFLGAFLFLGKISVNYTEEKFLQYWDTFSSIGLPICYL